jgi:TPR repeat protein
MLKYFILMFLINLPSYAGFREAVDLFESEQYEAAYEEFYAGFMNGDLRGNSYLLYLSREKHIQNINDDDKKCLELTRWSQSANYLQSSVAYIGYTKAKQKKKANYVKILLNLYKTDTPRAAILLAKISDQVGDIKIGKIKLDNPNTYIQRALYSCDREVYCFGQQNNYLKNSDSVINLILESNPNGRGEYLLYSNAIRKGEYVSAIRWLTIAAIIGYEEAITEILEKRRYAIYTGNCMFEDFHPVQLNELRKHDFLSIIFKAGFGGQGEQATYLGNLYDRSLKEDRYNCPLISPCNQEMMYWYRRAADTGSYLASSNLFMLAITAMKKNANIITTDSYCDLVEKGIELLKREDIDNKFNDKRKIIAKHILCMFNPIFCKAMINGTSSYEALLLIRMLHAITDTVDDDTLLQKVRYYFFEMRRTDLYGEQPDEEESLIEIISASSIFSIAANEVGCAYLQGNMGLEKNHYLSFKYFSKANDLLPNDPFQDLSRPFIYSNLGLAYLHRLGCDRNLDLAYQYFKMAHELQSTDMEILFKLGVTCILMGDEHIQEARKLLKLAIDGGNIEACASLAALELRDYNKGSNKVEIKRLLQIAYKHRNFAAAYNLGILTLIESSDLNLASRFFQRAIEWGNKYLEDDPQAQMILDLSACYLQKIYKLQIQVAIEQSGDDEISYEMNQAAPQEELQITEEEEEEAFSIPAKVERLNRRHQAVFEAIMDPKSTEAVKWDAFIKLAGALAENDDYIKPAGGSKVNIKLGSVKRQMHMPNHKKMATLCPGRINKARSLLEGVVDD